MIKDLLENLDIDFEKAIIDNYQLKDGLYVKIKDEGVEYFIYKKPKDQPKEMGLKDLEGNIRADMYEWFAKRDYLSTYLNSNKALDPPKKKIHNNNYLTLFVKAKEFTKENLPHYKAKLYDNLTTFKSFTKPKEKEVLKDFSSYIHSEERQKDIKHKKTLLEKHFDEIEKIVQEHGIQNYVKIFFDEPIEKYEEEAKIYYALKIYNKIEHTYQIDGKLYGLSDFNMGLNAKKPFLEHKTRGFAIPFLVEKDEIIQHKKLFDFLKYQANILDAFPKKDRSGFFLQKRSNNDQAEIVDFEIVAYDDRIVPTFYLKDFLRFKGEDQPIDRFSLLFQKVDELFYNSTLQNNLYNDVYNKLPNELQNLIYLTRDGMKALRKGTLEPLLKINQRYADRFIELHIRQNRFQRAKEALNLKLSLKAYQGETMDIKKTLEAIEKKIEHLEPLDKEEFFLLCGQIIYYLLWQSEKSDKRADMIEPFLRAGRSKKLKSEIETLFFKYKHKISLGFRKFNSALALVEAFEEDSKVARDHLLVGILADNIFYKKDKQ